MLCFVHVKAQGLECGTPSPTPAQAASLRAQLAHIDVEGLRDAGTTCIPMQAHIVRASNGTGGPSLLDLNIAISYLNHHYRPANIQFFWVAPPEYVNNDSYYDYHTTEAVDGSINIDDVAGMFSPDQNALNIYLVNSFSVTFTNDLVGLLSGYSPFPYIDIAQSNRMLLDFNYISSSHVFMHEMGHYFSLHHTFATSLGRENVSRDPLDEQCNCRVSGDELCDTEADPGVAEGHSPSEFQDDDCNYTGDSLDAYDVPYDPPVENPMSYWRDECATTFTPGQIARIIAGLGIRLNHTSYSLDAGAENVPVASNLTATFNGTGVDLAWTDNASNELGYLIERSSVSATSGFVVQNGAATGPDGTTWTDHEVQGNSTYWYRIKASNGACNAYSESAPVEIGHCDPIYTQPCGSYPEMIIDHFGFEGDTEIINNTDSGCSSNSYGEFTNMQADVIPGGTYQIVINTLASGVSFPKVQVWLDVNQDGDFDDPEEQLLDVPVSPSPSFQGTVTIPVTTMYGSARLRVRCWDGSQASEPGPCGTAGLGEAEDYTLNVTGGGAGLAQLQYWFDDSYLIATTVPIVGAIAAIDPSPVWATGLAPGVHTIHLRVRDHQGAWSSVVSKRFIRAEERGINGVYCWFDDEVDVTYWSIDPIERVIFSLDIHPPSNLAAGPHILNFGARDAGGRMSSVVSKRFIKTVPQAITGYQYWYASDPDNITDVPTPPNSTMTTLPVFLASSLPLGPGTVYFRARDESGKWSSAIAHDFTQETTVGIPENSSSQEADLRIMPSPTSGKVTVLLPTSTAQDAHLYLVGTNGYVFQDMELNPQHEQRIQLDLTRYPAGGYYVRYDVGDKSYTGVVVKL